MAHVYCSPNCGAKAFTDTFFADRHTRVTRQILCENCNYFGLPVILDIKEYDKNKFPNRKIEQLINKRDSRFNKIDAVLGVLLLIGIALSFFVDTKTVLIYLFITLILLIIIGIKIKE